MNTQLNSKNSVVGINTIIVDEVHMAKADVLKRLLTGPFAHCQIRWGLTGTVPKEEYEYMGIKVSLGEVTHRIPAKELQDKGVLANCHVNVLQTLDTVEFKNYQEEPFKFFLIVFELWMVLCLQNIHVAVGENASVL